MKHLVDIDDLSVNEVEALIEKATHFKNTNSWPNLSHLSCSLLFYENSTRTRVSFELAAKKLAMTVVRLDLMTSSASKGESELDTVRNLQSMGINYFVLRHQQENLHRYLIDNIDGDFHLINAGSGKSAHPTQGLLDAMTIFEHKKAFSGLKVAFLGDIKHSRVTNSLYQILVKLGVENFCFIAPKSWQPANIPLGETITDVNQGLIDADVIVCLRIQKERLEEDDKIDVADYQNDYCLTAAKLKLAKPNAIVMHPGPINRGVEIESQVADCTQSVILEQAKNGLFMRMALLHRLSEI